MSYHYVKHEKKTLTKQIDEVYDENLPYAQFKVTNQRTVSILNKKQIKPIHERLDEILAKKKKNLQIREQEIIYQEELDMRPVKYRVEEEYRNGRKMKAKTKMNAEELQEFRD